MIYYTGDIHGQKFEVVRLAKRYNLTREDIIVILGDAGLNYCGDERDNELKEIFARLKPTIFCIHGNHEMRPHTIPTYMTKEWNGGTVWYNRLYIVEKYFKNRGELLADIELFDRKPDPNLKEVLNDIFGDG